MILSLLSAALTHTNFLAALKTCLCSRTAGAQQHKSCLAALAHYLWKSHSTVCCIMRPGRWHNQHLTPTLWYHLVPPNLELEPCWKPVCPHLHAQEGSQWPLHISHILCRRHTALLSYSKMKETCTNAFQRGMMELMVLLHFSPMPQIKCGFHNTKTHQ